MNPSAVYWMDMTFFTLICCKNCNDVCLKRPLRSGLAHLKKWVIVLINKPCLENINILKAFLIVFLLQTLKGF